jgi:hypothetical protein
LKSVSDRFGAVMNRADDMMRQVSVRKLVAETTVFEMFSPLPLSSDTCLSIEEFRPKSEINVAKDVRSVSPAMTPISSCVISLAIKAKPETAINVERMF